MPQKVTPEKLQKLTLMLGRTVAAMRVNEMLMCRLLRWAAARSDDPRRFIEEAMEKTRDELQRAGKADGSTVTAKAADEALEYLDDLATAIQSTRKQPQGKQPQHKQPRRDAKGLALLEGYHFPSFTSALHSRPNGATERHGRRGLRNSSKSA